jgi:hypothetical protein
MEVHLRNSTLIHSCVTYEDVLQSTFDPWLQESFVPLDFGAISRFPHEEPSIFWIDHLLYFEGRSLAKLHIISFMKSIAKLNVSQKYFVMKMFLHTFDGKVLD